MISDELQQRLSRDREIEKILLSDDLPVRKVQRIKQLGVEEETADEIVGSYQIGQMSPLYYERLDYYDNGMA